MIYHSQKSFTAKKKKTYNTNIYMNYKLFEVFHRVPKLNHNKSMCRVFLYLISKN